MEIQFPKSEQQYLKSVCRGVQEQELTQELRLGDGMPDIGRVISSWGQVILRSKEWRRDSVAFSGGVMAWVLYAPEDGTQPRCIESWIPFQMKWDIADTLRDGAIRIHTLLRFSDARNISPRKIMLRMGVAAMGEAWLKDSADVYAPGQMPDGIQLLMKTYPVRLPKEAGEKAFAMDEVLELPSSLPVPEKLIYYTMQPVLREKKFVGDKLLFRGNGRLHLVYAAEDGKVSSYSFEVPFSQYVEMEGNYSEAVGADIWMGITSLEVETEKENQLRLKCGLLAQYLLDDMEMLTLAADAYSPSMDVIADIQSLQLPAILEQKRMVVEARETAHKDAHTVVDTVFLPDFPRQRRNGDQVQWEIPGMFQTLYYDTSHMLQGAAARWDGQLSTDAASDSDITANVILGEEAGASVGMDAIDMQGQAVMDVQIASTQGIPMVACLTVAPREKESESRPSLILRRAGEDSLWQIAKTAGSTVEAIQQINGLEGEPAWDRMLLIPVL